MADNALSTNNVVRRRKYTEDSAPGAEPETPNVMSSDIGDRLNDMLYGTRTTVSPFSAGPVSGYFGEQRMGPPPSPYEPPSDNAMRIGSLSASQGIGPFNLRGGVDARNDQYGTTVSPNVGIGYGPLSVNAALDRRLGEQDTTPPRFGAALNLPIGQGNAMLSGSITPGQIKTLAAQFNIPVGQAAELAAQLSHTMPQDGVPDTRFGVAYRRRF